MRKDPILTITNEDNMNLMARYPDNHFDLAIVDPPYGIDVINKTYKGRGGYVNPKDRYSRPKSTFAPKVWDKKSPDPSYFKELFRVSKNQIIWGANHYTKVLPDSRGWIFWDKDVYGCSSDGEIAFTSFDRAIKKVFYIWDGMRQGKGVGSKSPRGGNWKQGNKGGLEKRIHPTQKPVALYKWLLTNYAKQGDKILDTHLGSGSIAIACHDLGFDLTACELDKDYYEAAMKRINTHRAQVRMF